MKKQALLIFTLLFALLACPGLGVAGQSVVVGVSTSLTFLEGKESLKAVEMAVEQINQAGGVQVGSKKLPMKIESIDIRDAAKGVPVPEALLGMEKLILEKKPTALVVGPFRSEALLAGMELLGKHKVPLLGTIAMTPKTEGMIAKNPKYKYVFRTCLNAKYFVGYIKGVMDQLNKEYGFTKVYIINQDVAWARATAGIMKKLYGKMGWEVLGHETFPIGAGDFSSALMKAKMKKAQVILPVFDMPTSGILVKQWRSMRVPALMAGFISPLAGPAAWKAFDQKIGGAVNSIFELGNVPSTKYPPAKAFYDAYEKKYGKPIEAGHGPAPSYASIFILKAAIEKAGSLDPEAIVEALKKTDLETPLGRVKFSEGHQALFGQDPAKSALGCFIQWNDQGKRVVVYPPSIAMEKIALPKWMKSAK
ncbi:ABC transporter substrate-binding protein [Dethiosulfatarculus sandiegensis]|uniref:Amino acid ABC transporter substrate-binding protein n=1 Tax=Dethiosulfatarculus sandiegensis TaxID=1429043 RepID=A0A0D2JC60_9BACT|nr:ABC transporter substrate-binding protein [Dethiosulfatarculus sandiegensis]KIX13356.1 amino acid ABC transporter substrate-binding protein [Dethiosulfatarculus sandiegensis]